MKTGRRKLARGLLVGCAAAFLASSCGGGGGGSSSAPPGTISFSLSSVTFKVTGAYAAAPSAQTITASVTGVTSGTVYYKVVANNAVQNSSNGFFTVSTVTVMGDSGTASVIPAIPSSIGVGTFKGTITVSACLNDSTCQTGQLAGSPVTIPVEYDIASGVDGTNVTPRVVAANAAGTVILRGSGFTGATSVSFGSVAATSFTVVSDSEIDASYPSLAAGTYPVTIDSGLVNYTASLVAVSSPAFTATLIPYPSGVGFDPGPTGIEYDAQRSAVFILFPAGSPDTDPTLMRYAFDGTTSTWDTSPTQISMAGLVQVHLSPDGTHLLALVAADAEHTSIVELDPVTLAQTNVYTAVTAQTSAPTNAACGFAIANDGNAILTFGDSSPFVYGTSSHTFTAASDGGVCSAVASGNGSVVAMGGAIYTASNETMGSGGGDVGTGSTADFTGDKFTYFGQVENDAGQTIGWTNGIGGNINAAGTRAYSLIPDPTTCAPDLNTFDLTATPSGSPDPTYPTLGAPIALPNPPSECLGIGINYLFATTPDGATLFLAGPGNLIVQPVSP